MANHGYFQMARVGWYINRMVGHQPIPQVGYQLVIYACSMVQACLCMAYNIVIVCHSAKVNTYANTYIFKNIYVYVCVYMCNMLDKA